MSVTRELPDVLSPAEVAKLCHKSVEWVHNRRFHLPCAPIGEPTVLREDVGIWIAAAAEPVERREPSDRFLDAQRRWGGPYDRAGVADRETGDIRWR